MPDRTLPPRLPKTLMRAVVAVDLENVASGDLYCADLNAENVENALALANYWAYLKIGKKRLQSMMLLGQADGSPDEQHAFDKALQHAKTAAEQGNADGQFLYGLLLAATYNVEQRMAFDVDPAEPWLRKAAAQDHPAANFLLGRRAVRDWTVPGHTIVSNPSYLPYLERAAELGWPEATELLDELAKTNALPQEAVGGNPTAMRDLALVRYEQYMQHSQISDAPPDIKALMRVAADGGDIVAMRHTANWSSDAAVIEKYLLLAATREDSEATYKLGTFYACMGDAERAERLFDAAAALGNEFARISLDELAEFGVEGWDCPRNYRAARGSAR